MARTTVSVLSAARGPAAREEAFDQALVFGPTPVAEEPVFEFDHTVTG